MSTTRTRAGFTAIELLVVLGLMTVVAGMAAGGVVGAQRRAAVNQAVAAVEQAVAHARVLARGTSSGENHRVVISGAAEDKGVRVVRDDEVVFEYRLGPQVHFFIDGELSTASRSLAFANGTGFTSDTTTGVGQRVCLGDDEELVFATPDQAIAFRFTIYEVGLVRTTELER